MYPKLIPLLLLICLSVLYACTKNENSATSPQTDLVDEAKLFFESQVLTGKDRDDLPKPETKQELPFAKSADWSRTFTQDLAFGKTVVVPLQIPNIYVSSDGGKTKQLLQDNAWLIIYKVDKKFKAEVVYKYPAGNVWNRKFTGDIEIQRWDGSIIKAFRYVNGIGKKIITHMVDGKTPQTEGVECETTDINQCVYFRDKLQDCRLIGQKIRCIWQDGGTGGDGGGGEGYPETGGGGTGGTSSGGTVPGSYEVRTVLNNLTSPCLIGGVNYVREGALRNQVSQILKNMFNRSDLLNARFYEEPLADTIDGITTSSTAVTNGDTTWNMNITLNSKFGHKI